MISILIPSKQEKRINETVAECEKFFPGSQIIIANDRHGYGKGWAMREALEHATGEIIVFIDGDMDIHPRMINRLLPFLEDYDIVLGRKQVRGLLSRRILTRLSRVYIWVIFGLNYDTQTGIKVFKNFALPAWKTNSFAFDVEILSQAKKEGFLIIEVPVETTVSKKMKIKNIVKSIVESIKIRRSE